MRIELVGALKFLTGFVLLAWLLPRQSQFKMCGSVIRNGCESGTELGNSAIEIPGFSQAASGIGGEDGGLFTGLLPGKFAARARFGGGSRGIAGLAQNGGKSGVCSGKVGLKTDGLAQGGRGFRKFSLLFEDRAESVVGLGIIGLGANGGSQFAGGIVEFTLLPEGDTKGVRRIGLRGIEGLGFAKLGDGFGEFVLELKGEPEILVESWIVGSALQSGLKFSNCSHEVGFLKIAVRRFPW